MNVFKVSARKVEFRINVALLTDAVSLNPSVSEPQVVFSVVLS